LNLFDSYPIQIQEAKLVSIDEHGLVVGTITAEQYDASDLWQAEHPRELRALLPVAGRLDRCPHCGELILVEDLDEPGVFLAFEALPSVGPVLLPVLRMHYCEAKARWVISRYPDLERAEANLSARHRLMDLITRGRSNGDGPSANLTRDWEEDRR
jgi:hypothetical protein